MVTTASGPLTDASAHAVREASGLAACPTCHVKHPTLTHAAVVAGDSWTCARCLQHWDGPRLATVATYAAWVAARTLKTPQ